jgi:Hsp20/alpha crystallin family protein
MTTSSTRRSSKKARRTCASRGLAPGGGTIDTERISASMEEGVLTIEVPKVEQARPGRIEVKASQT